ncbi:MAG: hypothetical protein RLZZ265_1986 [Verrucomicrobiota bacterium]
MRTAGLLSIYFLGVLLGGALLAPMLFQLGRWLGGEVGLLSGLASQPFHRYLNRCLLILALAGLWPLIRACGLGGAAALGFGGATERWRRLGFGLVAGFGSLSLVALALVATGVRDWNATPTALGLLTLAGKAMLTAGVVALMEEFLFRGVIFGALRQSASLLAAIVTSAVIYSGLHFLARVEHPGAVAWYSGLMLLPRMLEGMLAPGNLWPAGLTLAVGGAALALAYQRTGSLWFSIGLHAGWVFWLKVFKSLTVPGLKPGGALWGSEKLIDGWFALGVMVALLVGVARWPWPVPKPSVRDEHASRQPPS